MRCDDKMITTVGALVETLGGTAAIAEWLDVEMSAVSNWKRDNHLPAGWHLRFWLEIERRGLPVSRRIFGLPDDTGDMSRPLARTRRRRAVDQLPAA